jgi:hypothetical protein
MKEIHQLVRISGLCSRDEDTGYLGGLDVLFDGRISIQAI